jgi:inhibitor of KinA
MNDVYPRIVPLSECCVLAEFGSCIDVQINATAIALADALEASPFPGFVEAVPAYASTAVFFRPSEVAREGGALASATSKVTELIRNTLESLTAAVKASADVIEIPSVFDEACGPDLRSVSDRAGLSIAETVEIFLSQTYRVFMVGFLPGFAYMGEVDERIRVPRHSSPRTTVSKGSIGIAGSQTGIYPLDSPGGWQLIGRTEIELFTPNEPSPTLLNAGDRVRFVPI